MTTDAAADPQGELKIARHGRVLTLVISNPAAKNAMGPAMYGPGAAAVRAAAHDPTIGAIVIAGEGEAFCAGGNVARIRANRERPREVQLASITALHAWVAAVRESPRPVIAAVESVAAGAGCTLALACDLVVASAEARFAMSYVRIGLTPDGGGTHSLAHLVPRQLAMEWLLEGGVVSAERLHQLGVVNRVVPRGTVVAEALAWAERLANGPSTALARTKRLLDRAPRVSFQDQLDAEVVAFMEGLHGAECDEGTAAFLGKRPPNFQRG